MCYGCPITDCHCAFLFFLFLFHSNVPFHHEKGTNWVVIASARCFVFFGHYPFSLYTLATLRRLVISVPFFFCLWMHSMRSFVSMSC